MHRLPLLLIVALLLGCEHFPRVTHVEMAVAAPRVATYVRYRVDSPRGVWSREFVVDRGRFVERREAGGRGYALGLLGGMAWMQVDGRPPVEVDGPLAADERTLAAWIGVRVGGGEAGGRAEVERCHGAVCTVVYTPPDGHALWVDVDRATGRPTAVTWIAQHDAIESCEAITWDDTGGATVVASARCSTILDDVGRVTTTWRLDERHEAPSAPAWAAVAREDVVPLTPLREPAAFAIADPSSRVYVPVAAAGGAPLQLVLDTGSPFTLLSRRYTRELGVVPSPEPPMHVKPPFFAEDTYDAALVDRLVMGPVELHGVRVLIPRRESTFEGDEAGLLGMDLLSRFVIDVDGPASTLRFWPEVGPPPDAGFVSLPLRGASHGRVVVAGAVDALGPMPMIVDTGAPVNLIVGGPAMHGKYPHHRSDDVFLREDDERSDYLTEIDGMHLGPFPLPRMPAVGHDRRPDLPFLDGDAALVGLGVLRHFRVLVDARAARVRLAPGPSYAVLTRLGVEIEERAGVATIGRVVDGEHAWSKPLRVGDVVLRVDGRRVRSRDEALAALAGAKRSVRLVLERRGNRFQRVVALDRSG